MTNALVKTIENQTLGYMETRILSIYAERGIIDSAKVVEIYNQTFAVDDHRKIHIVDVSRALKKIQRIMLAEISPTLKDLVLEQLFFLYNEALASWEKSKQDEVVTTQSSEDGDKGHKEVLQTRTKGQTGDPRHWNNAATALKQLREIEGVDAPKKVSLILEQEMRLILEFLQNNISEAAYNEVVNAVMNYRSAEGEMIVDSDIEVLD